MSTDREQDLRAEDVDEDIVARRVAAWYAAPVAGDAAHQRHVIAQVTAQRARGPRYRQWLAVTSAAAVVVVGAMLMRGRRHAVETAPGAPVAVRFVLRGAITAAHVTVVGDFNGWNSTATPLDRAASGAAWVVELRVPPGRYGYAFVVDGQQWISDPTAPLAPDAFGVPTSVVVVEDGGAT